MSWKKTALLAGATCALAGLALAGARPRASTLVLSGLVTTDDVVIAPAVAGRLVRLHVREGEAVSRGQAVAELEPAELEAEHAYYADAARGLSSEVDEGRAAVRYQELDSAARIRQAAATVDAIRAERAAAAAQLEDARATAAREETLARAGAGTERDRDRARRAREEAQARVDALDRQIDAQQASLDLARATAEQVAARRARLVTTTRQLAAAEAQRTRAEVRLGYTRLVAPIDGVVDVRAARLGEFVAVGQPVLTLVDPDGLWVRADVEETYVDRIRLGDRLRVRLPSGEEREGVVFHRGVDAGFATQRDVGRTRRDIRTFELRLRVDNADRRLALGASVDVLLPVEP